MLQHFHGGNGTDRYNCLQAKVGREEELETTLQLLRGKNVNISKEVADIIVNFQLIMFDFNQNETYFEEMSLFCRIIQRPSRRLQKLECSTCFSDSMLIRY